MSSLIAVLDSLQAHTSSALWLSDSHTAIVADVHLGYSWAQRRRGELGPLADFRTREKLLALTNDLQPRQIIFLGDLVHAPRPCAPEREWIENMLRELSDRAEIVAVRGNHDRAFTRDFGHLPIKPLEFWSNDFVTAVHGDRLHAAPIPEHHTLIAGHLHPCLGVRDASGANHKLPVFLANRRCILLPAFSPFARGYDITGGLPADLAACFRDEPIEAYAATATRVARLGPLRRAIERISEGDVSVAAQFRRRASR